MRYEKEALFPFETSMQFEGTVQKKEIIDVTTQRNINEIQTANECTNEDLTRNVKTNSKLQ